MRLKIPTAVWSGALVLVGRATSQLGIVAAGIIVARTLGPKSYGLYAGAFALAALLVGGPATGLPIIILRRAAAGSLSMRALRLALRGEMFLCLGMTVVAGCAGGLVYGGRRGLVMALAAGLALASLSVAVIGAYVQCGHRRFLRAAASDVVAGALFPTLTLGALELDLGVVGGLIAIAMAGSAAALVAWTRLPPLHADERAADIGVRDALPFVALGTVNAGYGRVDAVALGLVATPQTVGYYAAGYRLVGPFSLIGGAFATVYLARLSERRASIDDWQALRRKGALILAGVTLVLLVALFPAEPALIRLLYGPRYTASIGPGRVLLLSAIPWCLYWPLASALNAVGLERQCAVALGGGLVVDFVAVIVFGAHFGALGAAWAWVGAETVTLGMMLLFARRLTDWPLRSPASDGEPMLPVREL